MVAEKIDYKIGKMEKSPSIMSKSEYENWKKQCQKNTKEYLFSIGQPLVYLINNKSVIEYPDGRIENEK
jgi:hypothetical protein